MKLRTKLFQTLLLCSLGLLFSVGTARAQVTITGSSAAGSYTTIAAAVTALNSATISSPVTVDITAGHTESVTAQITLTATGTSTNTITFQKSGAGANPKITRTDAGSSATSTFGGFGDGIIRIDAGDYITFDGIDVEASQSGIEYGYYLQKLSATNASQNVTIKNCTITMNKGTSAFVVGIYSSNGSTSVSSATGVTVTANSGRTENLVLTGNTISNVFAGIVLRGSSATSYPDQNPIVGQSGAPNTIQNFGGNSTSSCYGVYAIYQNGLNVSQNTINNTAGGNTGFTGTAYGIFTSTGTNSSLTVTNNSITLTSSASSGSTYGINNSFTGGISINANTISLNTTVANSGTFGFIYNGATASSLSVDGNTFSTTSFNVTGSTYFIYNSTASSNVTISNNQTSGTFTKTGSSGALYGYYNLTSTTVTSTENVFLNNFSNIDVSAGSGLFTGINSNTVAGLTQNFYNNTISNITAGSGTVTGIAAAAANTRNVYGNVVHTLTGSGSIVGISNGTGATVSNIYNNKIYGLNSTTTSTGTVYGISVTTIQANTNVYNNLIGNLTAPTANNTSDAIRGISISGTTATTNVNLSYNTIYLNATSTGADFSTSGIFHTYSATATSAALTMRNNIIYNNSTPNGTGKTSAFRRSGATDLNNYSTNSNNNLFYAGTPSSSQVIYYDGTNADASLPAFKTRVGPARESSSIREDAPFLSTTGSSANFLHIDPTVPTQTESGGITVTGITDDYDGNTRHATTPDIGADEFTGTPAIPMSYVSSTTVQQTGGAFAGYNNQTILRLEIVTTGSASALTATSFTMNANGTTNIADITNAKIYYTGGSATFSSSVLFGTATPTIANYTITGSQALTEGNNYFWLVYDLPSGATPGNALDAEWIDVSLDIVRTPSTSAPAGNKTIVGAMSGNYNVGASESFPNFTTLTEAINNLALRGVNNHVTLTLTNASTTPYNTANGETFPLIIGEITGAGAGATITIKSGTGLTPVISGSISSGALIRLDTTDYFIIDGSNSGGTDRSLTITNTATTTPTVIQLIGRGASRGATNNVIKNCIISTPQATTLGYGISIGGTSPVSAGADNDNNTVQNNLITVGSRGIYAIGTSTEVLNALSITGNEININTTTTTVLGIQVGQATGASIAGNKISIQTSGATAPVGISLETGFVSSTVSGNIISKVLATNMGGYGGRGITIGTGTATSALTIANNAISGVNGSDETAFGNSSSMGIAIGIIGTSTTLTTAAGGIDLYFNSVNMTGSSTQSVATITTALYIGSGASALNIRDNAFSNSIDNPTVTTDKNYAIYSAAANTAFTSINYNDYYVSGSQGVLGYIGSDRTDLAGIQAGFGSNGNSITSNPAFNGVNDLRPNFGSPLLAAGENPNNTGITNDLLNVTRGATPTIGAYESALDASGPIITYTALANTASTANRTITATITDVSGVATGAAQPLIYYRKGNSGTYTSATATSVTGDDYTFTIDHSAIGATMGNDVQYYFAAQDALGNASTYPLGGSGANPPGTTAPSAPEEYHIIATYVWQGTTSDFQVASNWSPSRTAAHVTDILTFDGSVTSSTTVTNIPSQTISQLNFINNVTATLNAATAGNTLTINGATGLTNLNIASGSTVNSGTTTSLALAYGATTGQLGAINGTLNINNASTFSTTNSVTTVGSSGVLSLNNTAAITATTANLIFNTGSNFNFTKTSGVIPTATYNLNSTINVTGITGGTSLTWPSSIGGLNWNCTSQTSNFSIGSVVTSINGDLTINNTGTGTFQTGTTPSTTVAVAGNATINAGTWNISGNIVSVAGNLTQNGGTIIKTATSAQNWSAASVNQTAGSITMNNVAGVFTLSATSGNMTLAGTVDGGTSGTGGMALGLTGTGNQTLSTTGSTISNRVGITVNKSSGMATLGNNFTINPGGILTLTAGTLDISGQTLTLNGTASGSGTLRTSSATDITIGGTGALGTLNFDQTTDGTTNVVNNLTLNRATTGTATLGNKLVVLNTLTVTDGTLNTGGFLTMRSTSIANTARVATVGSTGAINGNVTVERYMPQGKRAYRQLSSGVNSTASIYANWQEGGATTSGLGMHITGSSSGANGFDQTATGNPSMFTYTPGATSFTPVPNTNTNTLNALRGYRVFVMGDRNANLTIPNTTAGTGTPNIPMNSATTLRATGTLVTGTVTYANTGVTAMGNTDPTNALGGNAGEYSLIANPYWSPVSWNALTKTNLDDKYWIWDPSIGNRGAYVNYSTTLGTSNGSSNMNDNIQPGQAIFVRTTTTAATSLVFTESNKTSTFTSTFRLAGQTPSKMYISLYEDNALANNQTNQDGALVAFRDDFVNTIAAEDAVKFTNSDENIAILNGSDVLSAEGRHTPLSNDTVPLRIWKLYSNNSYTIKLDAQDFDPGITAWLIDKKQSQQYPVNLSGATTLPFSFSLSDSSSFYDRFMIVFNVMPTSAPAISNAGKEMKAIVYPNPVKNGSFTLQLTNAAAGNINIKMYNTVGQQVYQNTVTGNGGDNTIRINTVNPQASGIYMLVIQANNGTRITLPVKFD